MIQAQTIRAGIYLVSDDKLVMLPRVVRRFLHDHRFFVVLNGDATNSQSDWPTVSGCPISSQTRLKTRFDVKLAAGEGGVTKKCWVRIPAIQSIEKADLWQFTGTLDPAKLEQIDAALFDYLGQV
jgi:mRNA-degrading endonuclease toxin of MazEF toxin-antitoxin module